MAALSRHDKGLTSLIFLLNDVTSNFKTECYLKRI